jgi:uncharacterized protein (DUF2384 family)
LTGTKESHRAGKHIEFLLLSVILFGRRMSINKRKSVFVATGRYSKRGYEVKVIQFAATYTRELFVHSTIASRPGSLTLRQIRQLCLAETKHEAQTYEARFTGVKRVPIKRAARRLSKLAPNLNHHAWELLDQAVFAFGSTKDAMAWLLSPVDALNGKIPIKLAAKFRGWWQVMDALVRIEHRVSPIGKKPALSN